MDESLHCEPLLRVDADLCCALEDMVVHRAVECIDECRCLPIGRGTFGRVYELRDMRRNVSWAIKTHISGNNDPIQVGGDSFPESSGDVPTVTQERSAMRRVPSAPAVTELTPQPHPYILMEYLDGDDLDEVLPVVRRLSSRTRNAIGAAIAHAVALVGENGLIHRDVKPRNLMLTEDGRVKVIDFGLCVKEHHQPVPGILAGTLCYMAPETLLCVTSPKSDAFSTGAVLLETCSEKPLSELITGSPASVGLIAALNSHLLQDKIDGIVEKVAPDATWKRILGGLLHCQPDQRMPLRCAADELAAAANISLSPTLEPDALQELREAEKHALKVFL